MSMPMTPEEQPMPERLWGQHVRAHLEVVHHHGRQRGRGGEAGADDNQDVNLHSTMSVKRSNTL